MAEINVNPKLSRSSGKDADEIRLVNVILLFSILPFVGLLLLTVEIARRISALHPAEAAWVRKPGGWLQQEPAEEAEPDFGAASAPASQQISQRFHLRLETLLTPERLNAIMELRNRHYLVLDLILLAWTPAIALTLRHESLRWLPSALPALALYTFLAVIVKVSLFYLLGLYGRYWPYASVSDVSRLMMAVGQATAFLACLSVASHPFLYPEGLALSRSVPLIDGMLTALLVGGMRFSLRGFYDWHLRHRNRRGGLSVLIVGAGQAGMLTMREIWSNPNLMLEPVAFVDDDPVKVGTYVHGLPVLGTSDDINNIVDLLHIQRIFIALPSASLPRQQEIINICRKTGVAVDTLPGVYQLMAGHKTISPLPLIDIHRILKRDPVVVDPARLTPILSGARVMVTGAGGSIGSELCRQIALHQPAELILLGHGENSIFEINLDLKLRYPTLVVHQVIADVRHAERVRWAMKTYRPNIVFHTAAHKHVHYMEDSVAEAVTNNVSGTRNVLDAAVRCGVERFVLMSTDKAINPVSVMGATKRIAELLTQAAAMKSGGVYTAVRCGNVLGSRGSVIPTFQKQIASGGPVTVTHPDMYRYFMTIPEAVQLVLHSSTLGQGGEIFVLDMGAPVQILDMAMDLIKLSGFQPGRDIKIVFSGVRQGEKLQEELFLPNEVFSRKEADRIFVSRMRTIADIQALEQMVDRLIAQAPHLPAQALIEQMQKIIPEYKPYSAPAGSQEPADAPGGVTIQRPSLTYG